MNNLSLRNKILIAAITPLLILTVVILKAVYFEATAITELASEQVTQSMTERSKSNVKSYSELAYTAIKPFYED